MKRFRKTILMIFLWLAFLGVAALVAGACINSRVINKTKAGIISEESAFGIEGADCIIVLGCGVRDDGSPSDMLRDRLKVGVSLYKNGAAPKLLMSGDHGRATYDEVNAMKEYAIENGVPSENVFMDHAGFSTYESFYRAKEIFGVKKAVIVTQEYHLYRALYIAESFDIEAVGVSASLQRYRGQDARDLREVLARNKDFLSTVFKPKPTYLGKAIPINGNGDITNDK